MARNGKQQECLPGSRKKKKKFSSVSTGEGEEQDDYAIDHFFKNDATVIRKDVYASFWCTVDKDVPLGVDGMGGEKSRFSTPS